MIHTFNSQLCRSSQDKGKQTPTDGHLYVVHETCNGFDHEKWVPGEENQHLKLLDASIQDQPLHPKMATVSCHRDIHKLLTLHEQIEQGNYHAIMPRPIEARSWTN